MPDAHLKVFRGGPGEPGHYDEFDVPVEDGMVVLDALHWIQGHEAPDLAVRWNCKAAKCGSCSAEVDGRPSLTCKTRLSDFDLAEPITVEPMRAFPLIRDLVTDVSWNYAVNETIEPFSPPDDVPQEEWRWQQEDIERVQEYRKCIECFLCQDVCHVLRNHETEKPFMGPRYLVRAAGLELHPMDRADRRSYLKDSGGIGCATSPSAAPRSARSTSRSPTTRSSRSRSAWRTRTTTRSSGPGASCAGGRRDRPPGSSCRCSPGSRRTERDALARARRAVLDAARLRHPHRWGVAGQPGPRLGRRGVDRPRTAGCVRSGGATRRHDLGLPRHPDEQRGRVHRGRPGPRAGRASSARARCGCCSTRCSSWSSSTGGGGSRTRSSSLSTGRRHGSCAASTAGPPSTSDEQRTMPRTPCAMQRSTAPWPAARHRSWSGRPADCGGLWSSAAARRSAVRRGARRLRGASEAAGWPRVASDLGRVAARGKSELLSAG